MKIRTGLGVVVILGLIVFAGCTSPQKDTAEGSCDIVLKSYKVPERLAEQISKTVNDLLSRNAYKTENAQPPIGKAQIAPDGELLVAAPESFHDGLKDFIEQIKDTSLESSPSAEVNYWIIAGKKADKPATLEEFKTIKPALETIQANQGNMEFKLLDHAVAASSGQGVSTILNGSLSSISQRLSAYSDGSIVIATTIVTNSRRSGDGGARYAQSGRFTTQIEMKSGELIVLGQLSQEFDIPVFEPAKEGEQHQEVVNVYYIISAAIKK